MNVQPAMLSVPELQADLSLLSPATRQIAQVIGVQDLVAQIPLLEKDVSQNVEGARLRLLELRQELSDQLLLACDVYSRMQLTPYGGWGYEHLPRHIVPALHQLGLSTREIDSILVDNPRVLLTIPVAR